MGTFEQLRAIDCSGKTEKKKVSGKELTYLSWTFAFDEAFKNFEDTTYEVWRDPDTHLPYVFDENTGYMVFTSITINGVRREMWLPVMDAHNAAMKAEPYEVVTKYSKYTVDRASMTDVNKTIMRCLVKNLAMFGLGLYIYAGEDLPTIEEEEKPKRDSRVAEADLKSKVIAYINKTKMSDENIAKLCKCYGVEKVTDLNAQHCIHYIESLKKRGIEI